MRKLVAGLDIGSNSIKVLLQDLAEEDTVIAQVATPWSMADDKATILDANDLFAALQELLQLSIEKAHELWGSSVRIKSLAISGMGETGFLLDKSHQAIGPAFAWFDKTGEDLIEDLPANIRSTFEGTTGLPLGAQVSIAKILYWQSQGFDLNKTKWINVPEFVALSLGAEHVGEFSLMSRTGLIDQGSGAPWTQLLDALGLDTNILPRLVDAGTLIGHATQDWVPSEYRDAKIAIAGHDHLVAANSNGPMAHDTYYVSMGTAEVLLRIVDSPLTFEAREHLAGNLINLVRHVVPGKYVIVAGVKTGLLMRRALQLFGITDRHQRDALDAEIMASSRPVWTAPGISVKGARNDDGVLSLKVSADNVGPTEIFAAILDHGNQELLRLIEDIEQYVPGAQSTVLTGGWSQMESIVTARKQILPSCARSKSDQDTALGAAVFARQLLDS